MNEFIESGENFTLQRNGADVIHDGVMIEPGRVYGRTKVFKNGELVHNELKPMFADGSNQNAIVGGSAQNAATVPTTPPNGLKAYFAQSMSRNVNAGLTSLFSTPFVISADGGAVPAGEQNKSGIAIFGSSDSTQVGGGSTMITTNIAASNTYGRKWRGELTATTASQFSFAVIGYDIGNTFDGGGGNWVGNFVTPFATQQFPTQTLATNDTLTIEWEIFIA